MKKIKVYYGKTNAYNAEVIENVTDGKVIVLDTTKTLEEVKEFYNTNNDIYDNNVLNEFELTEIVEYEEN